MKLFLKKKMKATRADEIINLLNDTKDKLDAANNRYSFLTDSDMIDSAIFEIGSLNAKYRQLLKEIKSVSAEGDEAV